MLWGRSAESISKFLTKGRQVAVEGELRQNRWEQDGQQRSKLEVVAGNVQLLGGGTPAGSGNAQSQGQQGSFAKKSAPVSTPEPDHFDDDGIPF